MQTRKKNNKCFNLIPDSKVIVARTVFVLNHGKMNLLQPTKVQFNRINAMSYEAFPQNRSLFIPCYNFAEGRTTGFLCAIRTSIGIGGKAVGKPSWRLAVFQRNDSFEGDGDVHFFLFRKESTWKNICKCSTHQLFKQLEGLTTNLGSNDIIPLKEVQRKGDGLGNFSFGFDAKNLDAFGCFEQAPGPDFLYDATDTIFKQEFGKARCNLAFELKTDHDIVYVQPAKDAQKIRQVPIKREPKKLRTELDLVQSIVDNLPHWKMLSNKRCGKVSCPAYYCVPKKIFLMSGKYFLCPFQVQNNFDGSGSCRRNTKLFARIPNDKKDLLKASTSKYISPERFDEQLKIFSCGTVELFIVDPTKHPNGFTFSIVKVDKDLSNLGEVVFENDYVRIFREEKKLISFDSSTKEGCVAFRGMPWLFDTSVLNKKRLKCFELMHGKKDGCTGSRKSVGMDGFFSYTGPRSSGQASSSPIERSSHGHDLWNMKNSIPAFMTATLLGRILCTQSDKMLELSGNIIMMAAIMLENANDRRLIGGYENICFHKIVTMWFSSVSSFYGVLFHCPKIFPFLLTKEFEFYQSIHIDNNDRSSSFFLDSLEKSFQRHTEDDRTNSNASADAIYNDTVEYLKRYRAANGNSFDNKNTICCWSVIPECSSQDEGNKVNGADCTFEHFFCCENLFFALDISSNTLKDDLLGGKYGGSFLSRLVRHGSSMPVCQLWNGGERVGAALYPEDRGNEIPFAWGRSGGRKKPQKV